MRITVNNLNDVFDSPKASIETMRLRGYELIKELFVDNSGMGQDDELAYTAKQFLKRLETIVKKHGTVYTTLTRTGQFQVYVGIFKHTGKKTTRKIANNTWEILEKNGKVKAIRFHDTNIITYLKNGKIRLNSGGWYTSTTKERINRFLPANYYLFQKSFIWYLQTPTKKIKYKDGMVI